jgi:hypothetical protein
MRVRQVEQPFPAEEPARAQQRAAGGTRPRIDGRGETLGGRNTMEGGACVDRDGLLVEHQRSQAARIAAASCSAWRWPMRSA